MATAATLQTQQATKAGDAATARAEWRTAWPIVLAAGAGMSLASVSTYSIGIMMQPIEQDLGWSRAQIISGPALVSFVAVGLSSFSGLAVDKFGARRVGLLSASLLCAALAGMSFTTTNVLVWWGLWILVGLATSAMPTVWTTPVSRHFTKARGLALAVTLSGTGIGASFVPLIAGYFVDHHGWRAAYVALGAAWALFSLPLIFFFMRSEGATPRRIEPGGIAEPIKLTGMAVSDALRTSAFYKLALAAFCVTISGTALVVNVVPILSSTGISRSTAFAIAGITGVSTIVGRIIGGYMMDKMPARWIAAGGSLLTAIFPLIILFFPGSVTGATIGIVVFGLTAGPKIGAIIYLVGRHFGSLNLGTILGCVHTLMALGVGLGPLLASAIFDAQKSYDTALWISIPLLVLAALLFASLGKPPEEHAA